MGHHRPGRPDAAGGLLLVTDVRAEVFRRRVPLALSEVFSETIPVLELTREAFERLVKEAGYTLADVNASPPALPLRLQAEMTVPLSPPQATTTANVLGLIPGRDPELAQELVILSAHYDHSPGRGVPTTPIIPETRRRAWTRSSWARRAASWPWPCARWPSE